MKQQQLRRENEARVDWGIILSVLLLAVIGMTALYVAVKHDTSTTSVLHALVSQAVWYIIGILLVIVVMRFGIDCLPFVGY